ncbi:GntR family transcriptional regulator [Lapidilactobacillus wuchangensis]|uniref:GntR family transcriptional regulator n=1 Tax=Lapidilactobacillus wuchangensis TaxID=2486001 RepID=UPI000F7B77DD|nr:GntR family transcriptional regulator [Lapidilactobacillus wuchangensis]
MPKYEEISQELIARIKSGRYPVTQPLPRQSDLATEFETSRMTIQQALKILVDAGYLYSIRGSGTYIRQSALQISKLDTLANEYHGATYRLRNQGQVTSKILRFDTRFPDKNEQDNLLIKETDPVYDICRVRYLNKVPYAIEYTVMPFKAVPGITRDVLLKSIYSYIEQHFGRQIGSSYRIVRADKATAVDQKELDLGQCDPILEVSQVVYFEDGTPFELSRSRHPYTQGNVIIVNQKKTKGKIRK